MDIPDPTSDELTQAMLDADRYQKSEVIKHRLFLVPHAGVHESWVCALTTLRNMKRGGKILLLGTDHFGYPGVPSSGVVIIRDPKVPGYRKEHSLSITKSIIDYLHEDYVIATTEEDSDSRDYIMSTPKAEVIMTLAGPGTNVGELAQSISDWLDEEDNRSFVATSDFSHYKSNQDLTLQEDSLLIDAIRNTTSATTGNIASAVTGNTASAATANMLTDSADEVRRAFDRANACGKVAIMVYAELLRIRGLTSIVACYTDNLGLRKKWENRNILPESTVTYCGMMDYPVNDCCSAARFGFDSQFLLAYARSCIHATVLGLPLPNFVNWTVWSNHNNGVFVGIKDSKNRMSCNIGKDCKTRASVGRFQSTNVGVIENVQDAAVDCIADAADRWKSPITSEDLDNITVYINVLEDMAKWTPYNGRQILPSDKNGLYLTQGGHSATFLPSVWSDSPDLDFEEVMRMLSSKATNGQDSSLWNRPGAALYLYKTLVIE